VLELTSTEATVVTCLGSGGAVDAAVAVGGAESGRVAPDEAMLVVPAVRGAELLATATEAASAADAGALVVDATDGWSIWTITGGTEELDRAMARLTALGLPGDGFCQGDLARVPVKLFVAPGRVHILVPAMWRAYLRGRILARCATLQIRERTVSEPWEAPA
jgi:hypothetical protein